jgi:hypothetical protein
MKKLLNSRDKCSAGTGTGPGRLLFQYNVDYRDRDNANRDNIDARGQGR